MILFEIFLGILRNLCRNGLLVLPLEGLLLNDIHVACKLSVLTDGHVERSNLLAVQGGQILYNVTIRNLIDIHICYKEHARQMIFLTDFPCLLGSGLNAGLGADNDDRTVCNRNGLFHLTDKIKISGSIQNVELVIIPLNRNHRGVNRNLTLLFLLGKIADSRTILDLPQSGRQTAEICHCLNKSSLAAAAMSQDHNVTDFVGCVNFHVNILRYVIEYYRYFCLQSRKLKGYFTKAVLLSQA